MKRNPWPYAIILYFVVFIAALATWIVFAVHQDQELVRKDYYEQELKYQSEIERSARGNAANVRVSYDPSTQTLALALPRESSAGKLFFYRPSDSKLDREIPLRLSDGGQTLDVREFQSGLWKLHVTWSAGGAEFSYNEALVL
jgi:hypothetical protein